MDEVREKVYDWTLDLIDEGKVLQGLILMLSTWNIGRFKIYMTKFKLSEFEDVLYNQCDFDYFKSESFEKIDFDSPIIRNKIINIYNKLSSFKGVEYTGTSKVMHFICPYIFVMWDTEIRNKCDDGNKFETSAKEYLRFNKRMQEKYKKGEFKGLVKEVTIPRAIDLYNLNKVYT